ncbi:glutathione peroxidase [Chamaesiphon polymorphus]|uniref:Glutathione peroxidase n=1 Tax=Chamaesiphon polymorphus CCALA 037 TaxID=2107692 RepID=A0A2T1F7Q0_9CYAN|nr:glutathione peroxidase [Chamaesiphon polymorphus]PSB41027.1 glutathione peroxidase [Chamaesiphon polymorphus CCALA 037]
MSSTVYDFSATSIEGQPVEMSTYRDKVLLIVNTASQCGYTPQYKGLQELQDKYASKGFAVLGFPCNQFGQQEPGSASDIQSFCETRYGVSFPLFQKVDVKGTNAHPLFDYLQKALDVDAIQWNFAKYLVDGNGNVVKRYESGTQPQDIAKDIEALVK